MRYSSTGFGLLGDALAARAGQPYVELLRERVREPLGMSSTTVDVSPAAAGRLLGGHSRRGGPRPPLRDQMPAAGSLGSDADDMLRFLAACLDPPGEPPGPALALAQRIGRGVAIGLGWIIVAPRGRPRVVWHNGGTWDSRSFAGVAPSTRAAAVVMSNTARSVDRLGVAAVAGPHTGRPRPDPRTPRARRLRGSPGRPRAAT